MTRPGLDDMAAVPGGVFLMGSDRHYPEERPARTVEVGAFLIDRTPVTNAAFAAFVAATGHQTVAELPPNPRDYPGADPHALRPGAMVFTPPSSQSAVRSWGDWWAFTPGANWRCPDSVHPNPGPEYPAVQIAFTDALAYADWAGKSLPTEAEWEFAARGGASPAEFAWGAELAPGGIHMANIWQGRFPFENLREDGYAGVSPVGAFPANPFGLADMIGNVWEWTADAWAPPDRASGPPCCGPELAGRIPRHVIKGGSHLCAPNYCQRYRPAARQPQAVDSGTTHLGFRCVRRSC